MVLGACSNIIGISSYEVDPTLDEGAAGTRSSGGRASSGGKTMVTESGAPAGGDDTVIGTGGAATGGKATTGGEAAGGSGRAGAPGGGEGGKGGADSEGGAGGAPTPNGCGSANDCDDTIDCTTDTCNAAGVCVHKPKDTLCDAALCETCQAGIGCVAGPKTTTQLLLDPDFDSIVSDWDESNSDSVNIVTIAGAQSGTKVAKFGPALDNAKEQQYSDVLQYMTFPERTVAITLTGYYKLAIGTKLPADDYLVIALYEDGGVDPFSQFHSFEATAGAQAAWKAFSYNLPKPDVVSLAGTDQLYTFDLVAHVWDSVFQFDSLQLNATVCQ